MVVKKDLSIEFAGLNCINPFFLSSSPVGNNYNMISKAFEVGWGGVYYKTIGLVEEKEVSPIFSEVSSMGQTWTAFKNCEHFSQNTLEENCEHMLKLKKHYPDRIVIASFMGQNESEWKTLCRFADQAGVDAVEINLSCPHMGSEAMGADVGTTPSLVEQYTKVCSQGTKLPIIAKMTPNLTNMEPSAIAAIRGGAKAISAINTVKSLINIDYSTMAVPPVVDGKGAVSGLSGVAVKPIALRFIQELATCPELSGVPLSGVGGIYTWNDALDFMLLGARNIQVTTSVMEYGYRIVEDIISGIMHFMDERGFYDLNDIVGLALPNIVSPSEFTREYIIRPEFCDKKCVGCGRCYISCYDGGHQAIKWNDEKRRPTLDADHCVGCHLCVQVCPVKDCICPGELVRR